MTVVLHVLPHRGGGAETYLDLLERLPHITHERRELTRGPAPADAARSLPIGWLRLAHRTREARLVHAHGDVAATLALPLLRARPSVWTTHGLHALRRATGSRGAAMRAGVRAVVGATAVTLCCSRTEHAELAAILPARLHDRLRVVPNGVDLPRPDPQARNQLHVDPAAVVVLYLGGLDARKDPLTAIRAANLASRDNPRLLLLVAGDGPLLHAVREEAGEAVRVLGYADDSVGLLAAADVFVMPSRREGLSFAALEAMAHGLAMVVADEPSNREVVGEAGVVVPAGDARALAGVLGALASDRARRSRLGAAARERVAREFPVEGLLDGVQRAYAEAMASARAGRRATACN